MGDIQIQQVVFDEMGLVIAYQDLDDLRVDGAVVMQKQVRMAAGHPDYVEDMEKIHARVVKALRNALEDFDSSPPWRPDLDDDDDETERGMGE